MVASSCYLGDMLSAGGGCEITVTTSVKTALKKFRELLPVLTSSHLSYKPVAMYTALCVRMRRAPCSMPEKLGHWPRRTCSACSAMIGPWSDRSLVSSQRRCHRKVKQTTGKDRLSLNAGQKYCRMLQGKHSAILSTFFKLPFVINLINKIFVLSIFEWPLKKILL